MPITAENSGGNLDSFLQFLYGGLEGTVYIAARNPNIEGDWQRKFFQYPEQLPAIKHLIKAASSNLGLDVYIAPALFKGPDGTIDNFKVSNVVWTEFDGETAPDWTDTNTPSLIVQSSVASKQHVYWKLSEPITDVDILQDVNKRITYHMGADNSAWDANQVLRPPETINYKEDYHEPLPVHIVASTSVVYDIDALRDYYPAAPVGIEATWEITALPDLDDVILKYAFTPDVVRLVRIDSANVTDRSSSLLALAYGCAQMGMRDNEIMTVMVYVDDRWGKFKHRKDRMQRLSQIVTIAKNKYPDSNEIEEDYHLAAWGWETFNDIKIDIDWVIEGMLMDMGSMLFVGPGGIGKTQITLQFAIHLALGKDFLHYKIPKAKKIAVLSLEMGAGELQIFTETMQKGLTAEESAILEQNLFIIPYGEPLALNTPEGQSELNKLLEVIQPEGLMIDSIGSSVRGNLSSDENVQPLTEYNDKLRKRFGCFVWYIHHMRKAGDGQPTGDDVLGNQYFFNRATSVYAALRGKNGTLRVRNFKNRLAIEEKDYFIKRTETLSFELTSKEMTESMSKLDNDDKDESTSSGNFKL